MTYILYLILMFVLVYTTIKNVKLFVHFKHNKQYIECYEKMLVNDEKALECINNYIDNEKNIAYKNKARILKLYVEVVNCFDALENLKAIDLMSIYFDKGVASDEKLNYHSDTFVWLIMCVVKANVLKRRDVLKILNEKLNELVQLNDRVEYLTLMNTINMFDNKEYPFFNDLLNGNYVEYKYDKNLINIYKRIAASNLVYKKVKVEDFIEEDLKVFAGSKIGKLYMEDLGILKNYETAQESK